MLDWAIEGLLDALVTADPQGRILLANPAALRILGTCPAGTAPADWPGCFGLYLPDKQTPFPADQFPLARALRGEDVADVEVFVRNATVPGGLWICASGSAIRDDAGRLRGGVLVFRDISTAKLSELRLRKERDWGTAIVETAGALVMVLDREARITAFNRACEQTSGYELEEVRGRVFWEVLVPAEEVEPVQRVFEQLRSGVFPNRNENHWITKDGGTRVIIWSNTSIAGPDGTVEYVISTGVDVTERRRAEDELRRAHATLQAVIETSPLAIISMDFNGVVKTWNHAAEEMFGWRAAEVVGQVMPIVPEDDTTFFRTNLEKLRHGGTIASVERRRRRKDGTLIDVELWNAPQRDGSGNIVGGVSMIADMTERKRLEEQFRQVQKM
ncbi:MAG TPA: PAS domain S-box protein, partial [Bryobacteraceae bacterium]|nr:PAS domain S-box protein [Bryobacteraceae bacterium]